jgi:hypothetical protein
MATFTIRYYKDIFMWHASDICHTEGRTFRTEEDALNAARGGMPEILRQYGEKAGYAIMDSERAVNIGPGDVERKKLGLT